jgi:hypothetical protein
VGGVAVIQVGGNSLHRGICVSWVGVFSSLHKHREMGAGGREGNSSIHLNRTAKDGNVTLSYLSLDRCLVLSSGEPFNCAKGVVVVRLAPTSI